MSEREGGEQKLTAREQVILNTALKLKRTAEAAKEALPELSYGEIAKGIKEVVLDTITHPLSKHYKGWR